jgi:hypothetical protein
MVHRSKFVVVFVAHCSLCCLNLVAQSNKALATNEKVGSSTLSGRATFPIKTHIPERRDTSSDVQGYRRVTQGGALLTGS